MASQNKLKSIVELIDDPDTKLTHICCVSNRGETAAQTLMRQQELDEDYAVALASATILDALTLAENHNGDIDKAEFIESVINELKNRNENSVQKEP